jgi:acetoin utilization deacetylase AcuC-like enzyme
MSLLPFRFLTPFPHCPSRRLRNSLDSGESLERRKFAPARQICSPSSLRSPLRSVEEPCPLSCGGLSTGLTLRPWKKGISQDFQAKPSMVALAIPECPLSTDSIEENLNEGGVLMITGIAKDWRYKEHEMGVYHPESPQRIEAIYRMIEKEIAFSYLEIEPRPASEEEVQMVHTPPYVRMIKETAGKEQVYLDPDTSTCGRSYETALLAAGGLLRTLDFVMEGKIQNGFALVRPPGHHAEADHAMGFCLFNNVAIGASYLIEKYGLTKILIVDWDLHHGNGTEHAFYSRRDVLYFSTHQFPYYPGTGYWDETGEGEGEGHTVNVPLRAGKGDEDYLCIFKRILSPIASQYKPEFILVSAGFDIYSGDPLGGMRVSPQGFGALTSVLLALAQEYSQKKLALVLEGGYELGGLQEGVKSVLLQLSGEGKKPSVKERASPELEQELTPVLKIQKEYWNL